MKLSQTIGLPVLSAQEGSVCARVSGWLIDGRKRSVGCLLVDTGKWYAGATALPFDAVLGLGNGAVIISSQDRLTSLSQNETLQDIADAHLTGLGAQIFTPIGECLGKVEEIEVSDRGVLISLYTDSGESIAARRILVMGAAILVSLPDTPRSVSAPKQSGSQIIVPSSVGNPIVINTPPPPDLDAKPS